MIWEGCFFMQIKNILKSLLVAYALTGACLLGLAWLVYRMNFGTGPVTAGIIAVYVIACLAGGFVAGKLMRKEKYRWGTLTGLCYFMLLLLVSFAVQGKWNMTVSHAVTTFCMCLGGGALGGMLA